MSPFLGAVIAWALGIIGMSLLAVALMRWRRPNTETPVVMGIIGACLMWWAVVLLT